MNQLKIIMNIPQKCPECGGDVKLIPAGVSKKSGKPYPAFYACSSPACKWTMNTTPKPGYQKVESQDKQMLSSIYGMVSAIYNKLKCGEVEYDPETGQYHDPNPETKFDQQIPDQSQEKAENEMFDDPMKDIPF